MEIISSHPRRMERQWEPVQALGDTPVLGDNDNCVTHGRLQQLGQDGRFSSQGCKAVCHRGGGVNRGPFLPQKAGPVFQLVSLNIKQSAGIITQPYHIGFSHTAHPPLPSGTSLWRVPNPTFQPAALPPWLRGFCDRFPPLSPPPSQASRLLVPALIERSASPGEVSQRQRAGSSPLTSILLSALFIKQQQQARGPAPAHTNNTRPMKKVTPAPWDKRTSSPRQILSSIKSVGAMDRNDGNTRTSSSQTCKCLTSNACRDITTKPTKKFIPKALWESRLFDGHTECNLFAADD